MEEIPRRVRQEIEEQRPQSLPALLSVTAREQLVERGMLGLYRWYVEMSQRRRNWNPDTFVKWPSIRLDHHPLVQKVVEGFYGVEQYVPDYTREILNVVRRSHGRSHFQIRWGHEEEKHADLWHNALLFMQNRSPNWIRDYMEDLRSRPWQMLWDDPIRMTAYVTVQERATQLNYLNTALIARGQTSIPELAGEQDPVLAEAATVIARDEAAHYSFFLEVLRLYLYYFPARAIEALHDVVAEFVMPANHLLPDFQGFADALVKTAIYGPREYAKDVLQVVLDQVGVESRRALVNGIARSRQIPDPDGGMRETAFFTLFDYDVVESAVQKVFHRVQEYEQVIGFDQIDPTKFIPSGFRAGESHSGA